MTNKNYIPANYTVEIEVAKPQNEVFDRVIDVSKWWPEEFVGESIKLNSEFVFRTGDSHYSKIKWLNLCQIKNLYGLQPIAYAKQTTIIGQAQNSFLNYHPAVIIPC